MVDYFSSDWLALENEEGFEDDIIDLPKPTTKVLDTETGLKIDKSYVFTEDGNIKYCERTYNIKQIKIKVSKAAIERQKNWSKFGKVRHLSKGVVEKGVTNVHLEEIPIEWHGQKTVRVKAKPKLVQFTEYKEAPEDKPDDGPQGYVAPHLRNRTRISMYDEPQVYEIKIQNLPTKTTFMNIKLLMDSFYRNFLRISPPHKYKIKVRDTYNREKYAIVEFDSERYRDIAVEKLNGHKYNHHILDVRKSKPRRIRY